MLIRLMLIRLILVAVLVSLAIPVNAGFEEGQVAFDREDFVVALKEWYPLAEQGDARAQNELGKMYTKGLGTSKNEFEALKWYLKAADQGYAPAQCNLGVMYAQGKGIAKNEAEAVKWFRKAADQGYAPAQCNLGVMYTQSQGIAKDEAEAVKWFRKAADQGYAPAQHNLGLMYAQGQGIAKDETEAVKWFRKAADQGYAPAQYNLGVMYAQRKGIAKNEAEAVKWYRKAADQGYALAQYNLGLMYAQGKDMAKNEEEAVKWLRKAADQGNPEAQYVLGLMYAQNQGIAKNESAHVASLAQDSEKPELPFCPGAIRGLVLSGGGTKGAYQAGALWYLVNIAKCDFTYFVGTSTGAVSAALLSQAGNPFSFNGKTQAENIADLQHRVDLLITNYKGTKSVSDIADSKFLGMYRVLLPHWLFGVNGNYSFDPLRKRLEKQIVTENISNLIIMAVSLQSGPIRVVYGSHNPNTQSNFRPFSIIDFIIGSASIPLAVEPQRTRLWSRGILEEFDGENVKVSTLQPPGLEDPECQFQVNESFIVPCERLDVTEYQTNLIDVSGGPEIGLIDLALQTGAGHMKRTVKWMSTLRLRNIPEEKRRELIDIMSKSDATSQAVDVEFTTIHQLVDGGIAQNLPLENALSLTNILSFPNIDTLFILRAGKDKEERSDNKVFRNGLDIAYRSFSLLWDIFQNKSFEGEIKGPIYSSWLSEWYNWAGNVQLWRDHLYEGLKDKKLGALSDDVRARFPEKPRTGQGSYNMVMPPKMFMIDPQKPFFSGALDVSKEAINDALSYGCSQAAAVINEPEEVFKGMFYTASAPSIYTTSDPSRASICDELNRGELTKDPSELEKLRLAEGYLRRGDHYFSKDEVDKAIVDFTQVVRLNERHDVAYMKRGISYYKKRQYDLAVTDLNRAIEIYSKGNLAYRFRGSSELQIHQFDAAVSDFKKALEIDPTDYHSQIGLATVYYLKSDYDGAIVEATRALHLVDHTSDVYTVRGMSYMKERQYDKAISDFNVVLEKWRENNATVYYERGNAYAAKGENGRALGDLNKAKELGFNVDPNILRQLQDVLQKK